MSVLVALLALAQPASQPASQPNLPAGGTAQDVTAQVTMILEPDEQHVKASESWSFSNSGGRLVDASALYIPLPAGSRRLSLDENGSEGFQGAEDASRVAATAPLGASPASVAFAFLWAMDGGTAQQRRSIPVNVNGMRVIIEDIPGVEVSSNLAFTRRVRELNGLNFVVMDFTQPLPAGGSFELTVSGLPSRTTLPRTAALLAVAGLIGWFVLQLGGARAKGGEATPMGALAAPARRDRIVKALELLERDRAEDKITDKRHARRHAELMKELADVLREIELTKAGPGRG
jgi:hypothetical protein